MKPTETQNYVCGFLFSLDLQRVALILKNKPEWQKGKLNGIGGKIEPGERYMDAMSREFKEETGVDILLWDEYAHVRGNGFKCIFFRAFSDAIDKCQTMEDEIIMIMPVKDISNLDTIPNLKYLIPMALDKRIINSIILED